MADSQTPVFDTTEQCKITIVSGGEKSCILRWPTDAEWAERSRKKRPICHKLGRGKTKTEVPNFERVDAELFAKIREDKDGAPFDDCEASAAIGRLERFKVISYERIGDQLRIEAIARRVPVSFLVNIPKKQDVFNHERAALDVIDERRQQVFRVALEPSADLFDKIIVSAEGYAVTGVPIIHKDAVVDEVLRATAALEDDEDPE